MRSSAGLVAGSCRSSERARGLVTPPGLWVCPGGGCRTVLAPPRHVLAAWALASRW